MIFIVSISRVVDTKRKILKVHYFKRYSFDSSLRCREKEKEKNNDRKKKKEKEKERLEIKFAL